MVANAWVQTRVAIPPSLTDGPILTDLAGDGLATLRILRGQAAVAGPHGALSFPAVWRAGRASGEATVTVFPFWSWGYELHLAFAPPRKTLGRIEWPRRRLARLAGGLAEAMRASLEEAATARPARTRRSPLASETKARWLVVSATSSSPGR